MRLASRSLASCAIALLLALSSCATPDAHRAVAVTLVFVDFYGEDMSLSIDDTLAVSGVLPTARRERGFSYSTQMRIPARSTFRLVVDGVAFEQTVEIEGQPYAYIFPRAPPFVLLSRNGPELLD